MISTVESHLPNVSYPNLHCPSPQNGDFRKIFKVFTALIRPENKKKSTASAFPIPCPNPNPTNP